MVRHGGSFYHFRTVEQAAGFYRGLQEGKSVESCRQRWRPNLVRVAVGTAPGSERPARPERDATPRR
ncbi:hypothetical protein AKI39_07275 [Bordetella sp. H567]|nr:hypothetical protein AKI39_07275 [Bordetella sp. H567]